MFWKGISPSRGSLDLQINSNASRSSMNSLPLPFYSPIMQTRNYFCFEFEKRDCTNVLRVVLLDYVGFVCDILLFNVSEDVAISCLCPPVKILRYERKLLSPFSFKHFPSLYLLASNHGYLQTFTDYVKASTLTRCVR